MGIACYQKQLTLHSNDIVVGEIEYTTRTSQLTRLSFLNNQKTQEDALVYSTKSLYLQKISQTQFLIHFHSRQISKSSLCVGLCAYYKD